MKASVYIATSLDGFIARENGALDWLPGADGGGGDGPGDGPGDSEDYGYHAFMATVDAIVMGRHTYETVRGFGDWPYDMPVVVLSSRPVDIPTELKQSVEAMAGAPKEVFYRLADRGFEHLYVDGGATIQRFLRAGLIGRLTVTRVPVLLGSGIPLFGPLDRDIHLRHVETKSYASGLVQSIYDTAV